MRNQPRTSQSQEHSLHAAPRIGPALELVCLAIAVVSLIAASLASAAVAENRSLPALSEEAVAGRTLTTTGNWTGGSTGTFGFAGAGSRAGTLNAHRTRGSLYVAPGGGVDFDTARAYLSGGASAQPVRAVVYETSSGSPTSLRAQSDAVTIVAGRPAGWVDFAFPSTVSIDGGSTYLLGLISGETTAQVTIYGSTTGAFFSGHDLYDDGAAATFAVAARSSLTLSLYAVPQPLTYSRRWLRCDADGRDCGTLTGATSATSTSAGAASTTKVTTPRATPIPAGGDPLSTYEVRLTPNYVSPNDGAASNYQAVWVYPSSPTTPYRSPDTLHQQSRYLLLDPRVSDADGRAGRDEWWFVIERNWPSGFDPQAHGDWGRLVNFHNVAGDVGWDSGSGVSALALDWLSGASAPQFSLEYHDGGKPHYLPTPSRDAFHTYVVHFIAGRTDGTTVRPGALTVWADGADSPAIDLSNINTLQRAGGATQQWMQLWEGDYTRDLPKPSTQSFVLTRVGATLAEALADRPTATGTTAPGQYYTGSGTNLGPPTATEVASRLATNTRIPASLGGTG